MTQFPPPPDKGLTYFTELLHQCLVLQLEVLFLILWQWYTNDIELELHKSMELDNITEHGTRRIQHMEMEDARQDLGCNIVNHGLGHQIMEAHLHVPSDPNL